MKKVCAVSKKEFEVTDEDLKFYDKMGVPIPTLCPKERQRRRLTWRNERHLYKRSCDKCKKSIISVYDKNIAFPVYCHNCWWRDGWNAIEFGYDFDFSRSFFKQFKELQNKVPHLQTIAWQIENSVYTNHSCHNKNCYMCINVGYSEDCFYCSNFSLSNKNCVDCFEVHHSELCYFCINTKKSFNSKYLINCDSITDSSFCYNCKSCDNCFGCFNLRHKKFHIFNEPYSEEKYHEKLKTLFKNHNEGLDDFTKFLQKKAVLKYLQIENCEKSEGDFLKNCKNVRKTFNAFESQDSTYCYDVGKINDCFDTYEVFLGELQYETHACNEGTSLIACSKVYESHNCILSEYCWNSHNLLGCIGLKHQQYCILNKQYSKEEYFKLRDKIIEHMKQTGEWGEFFPIELSPFAYNETVAQEYFPMTKEEVLAKGWKWHDDDVQTLHTTSLPVDKIPDDITNVPDTICNEILACKTCDKNYKIQKSELQFYRKMNLPIPHKCPNCRHTERMKLRNPRKLWTRKCDKCGIEIQTTFAPGRPEKVYCEKCYLECVE